MAKLSRSELKGIVKECLVEILSEGISASNSQSRIYESRPPISSRTRSKMSKKRPTRGSLDSIVYGGGGGGPSMEPARRVENSSFNDNVKSTVSSLTSDPTLASIFEDTARTTLQEQLNVDNRGPVSHQAATYAQGDAAAKAASASDPMDLFAGAADKWSQLAFPDPIGK